MYMACTNTCAKVKQSAPAWSANVVVNNMIVEDMHSDDAALAGRWKVLVFYPLDFTFVCPTELIAFNDRLAEFEKLNASVLGISVDSEYSHLKWVQTPRKEGGLKPFNMPLVSDITKRISKSYGVLHNESVALRGLFIIDPNGVLRHSTINDLPIGRDVDETLRVLQALQFHDEHGEVCPANWRPGSATMIADPVKSLDYFGKSG
jgi:alkyl hydroperoxide reductase subunit AhpC